MTEAMITALPLSEDDRGEFLECANTRFERVLARMEPADEESVRRLWNAEGYLNTILADKLPISRKEALGLVEAFMVIHVADLAVSADEFTDTTIH